MGLTVKRENTLTSLFDQFATLPADLKEKVDLKDGEKKEQKPTDKKADKKKK
ncbi:SPJ_0845 family protein [Schleiferilactobacillus perolens]|jgi:hypothetical protein|uniref:SPJ_0845 family protein n=1 Tax=Schleiferilactobacillus perolens TaxID=100468 RepID=UPI002353AD12|nr:SPJ_0845 family protein [Schleiferilactobacillus perolens]MCI2171249.1 hypothetical protein [Schleiferilactobacillus perolens]